uniref:Uncharacterized protein n=1 Tax=Myoviridae sp. ctCo31 TaxID=2825053 RepID=A0A8S5UMK7_9CAUD|nr:MAG TPA: hypothetical protein [Myoviridae sp. ctCo31]
MRIFSIIILINIPDDFVITCWYNSYLILITSCIC